MNSYKVGRTCLVSWKMRYLEYEIEIRGSIMLVVREGGTVEAELRSTLAHELVLLDLNDFDFCCTS